MVIPFCSFPLYIPILKGAKILVRIAKRTKLFENSVVKISLREFSGNFMQFLRFSSFFLNIVRFVDLLPVLPTLPFVEDPGVLL